VENTLTTQERVEILIAVCVVDLVQFDRGCASNLLEFDGNLLNFAVGRSDFVVLNRMKFGLRVKFGSTVICHELWTFRVVWM
jgi:hypothetical protein